MTVRSLLTRIALAITALGSANCFANTLKPSPEAAATAGNKFDFSAWNKLLETYVDDQGRVDYQRLKQTPADLQSFDRLFAQVAAQKLEALPSKAAREAFLIDAYNVCVWKEVLDRLPKLKSVNDEKTSFFYFTKFIVAGKEVSLYSLENEAIRAVFKDPRVHMALNCASGGCPLLPRDAFEPAQVNQQLDREAKRFVNEPRNVHFDPATNTVTLSHIFDWYAKDFDKKPIQWINQHRPSDQQIPPTAKIKFADYDWHLNDKSLSR